MKRPAEHRITKIWIIEHILKPARMMGYFPVVDTMGNVIIRVDAQATTLFSCHTDTVHREGGVQRLMYDPTDSTIWKNDHEALGADDGAGVFVLMRLLMAKVPGLYIFHHGEERGCIGSKHIVTNTPKVLDGIKRAIAFDRRGTKSIITRMSPGVVCSGEFADALATAIGMEHQRDPTGSMTDTGRYRDVVPECTNVSVGYSSEHGGNETLDAGYLYLLVEHLVQVDFEALPTVRDPKKDDYVYQGRGYDHYRKDWLPTPKLTHKQTWPPIEREIKGRISHPTPCFVYPGVGVAVAELAQEEDVASYVPDPLDDKEAFMNCVFDYLDLEMDVVMVDVLWDALDDYIDRYPEKVRKGAEELETIFLEIENEKLNKAS